MTQRILSIIGMAIVVLLVVLIGMLAFSYARTANAQTGGVPGMRQVTVVGHGEVQAQPDTATVQIGVQTQAADAKDALAQNTQQTQAVQAKLKDLGIADKDMQTSNFSINPMYDNNGRQVTGYTVSNIVSVTIRNLDQAGTLLDQVVQAGANSIYGINFSVSNPEAVLNEARTRAIQNAQTRANQLAQAAGASAGEVLVISENIGQAPPVPMMAREAAAGSAAPIQAGEQTLSVDVQVTFALR
jgi:uncharacterized protein YggE